MDSNTPTRLDALFAEARREPLVMPRAEVDALLDRSTRDDDRPDHHSFSRQGTRIMYTLLIAAALIGGGSLAGLFNQSDTPSLPGGRGVSGTAGTPAPASAGGLSPGPDAPTTREYRHTPSLDLFTIPENKDRDEETKPYVSDPVAIGGIGSIVLTDQELAALGLQVDTAGVWIFYRRRSENLGNGLGAYELNVNEDPNNPAISARSLADDPSAMVNVPSGPVEAFQVSMHGTIMPPDPEKVRKPTTRAATLFPTLVTDDLGAWRMYSESEDDSELEQKIAEMVQTAMKNHGATAVDAFNEVMQQIDTSTSAAIKASRLIPILVRTGHPYTAADSAAHRWRPDCIFWYKATPEFLAAIPAHLRVALQQEIRAADRLDQRPSNLPVDEFIRREPAETRQLLESYIAGQSAGTPGAPSVDAFRSASGAILSTRVVPNPTTDHAVVRYALKSPRRVTISLHDINGGHIRDFVTSQSRTAGEHEESVDLSALPAGIYLVSISTEKGEKGVQRMIVRE